MTLFDGHHTAPLVEHWSGRLRIAADHALVGRWQRGWSGTNRLPRCRLFLIDGPEGGSEIRWGTQRVDLRPGHRYLMPPGAELAFRFAPGLRMVAFHFDCELGPGLDCFADLDRLVEAPCPRRDIRALARRLRALDTPGELVAACAALAALVADLVPLGWDELRERELLQRRWAPLLRRIDRDGAATRIALLAAEEGLGADQLSKRFRRDFGLPLKTVIDQRVTRRAADLLRGTDRSLAEIADELGFTSEFYASRFLKKQLGMSPSRWRRLPMVERV